MTYLVCLWVLSSIYSILFVSCLCLPITPLLFNGLSAPGQPRTQDAWLGKDSFLPFNTSIPGTEVQNHHDLFDLSESWCLLKSAVVDKQSGIWLLKLQGCSLVLTINLPQPRIFCEENFEGSLDQVGLWPYLQDLSS